MKKRILYILTTIILLAVEVLIALYGHDDFVRPYIGDILVVIAMVSYC